MLGVCFHYRTADSLGDRGQMSGSLPHPKPGAWPGMHGPDSVTVSGTKVCPPRAAHASCCLLPSLEAHSPNRHLPEAGTALLLPFRVLGPEPWDHAAVSVDCVSGVTTRVHCPMDKVTAPVSITVPHLFKSLLSQILSQAHPHQPKRLCLTFYSFTLKLQELCSSHPQSSPTPAPDTSPARPGFKCIVSFPPVTRASFPSGSDPFSIRCCLTGTASEGALSPPGRA